MQFIETPLRGAWVIQPEKLQDHRGFFARTFCEREFAAHGLATHFVQCNISFNQKKGTLRGMHYQAPPNEEAKLIRCTAGSIFDVIIDLRPASPTFKKHFAIELNEQNRTMLYVPEHFAHGFQTLVDNTEVFYQMSAFYESEAARGVRWNDPAFAITWPEGDRIILDRDARYPDFG